ncbi:MAG: sigma-70 family RNA polymerase sigma factor [Planctomycetota bacterium]
MHGFQIDPADLTWLSKLARALLREPHAADDLVQDTVLAALKGAPPAGTQRRSWLAGVAKRLAARRIRSETRRRRREAHAASADSLPASADLAARAELAEHLAAAARRLPEPFRRTILLRFLEGLSNRDIAQRDGDAIDTVRARVRRGLALLRHDLEQQHGSWEACGAWLLPLSRSNRGGDAANASTSIDLSNWPLPAWIAMKTKWISLAAGAALLGCGAWALFGQRADETRGRSDATHVIAATQRAASARPKRADSQIPAGERTAVPQTTTPVSIELAPPAETLRVVVVDESDTPIANATGYLLAASDADDEASEALQVRDTKQDGAIAFRRPEAAEAPETLELRIVANGYRRHVEELSRSSRDIRVVLQRGRTLRGRVVDAATGRGIPGLQLLAHSATKSLAHVSPSQVLMRGTRTLLRTPRSASYEQNRATTDPTGNVVFSGLLQEAVAVRSVDPGWRIEGPGNCGSDDNDVTWKANRRLGVVVAIAAPAKQQKPEVLSASFRVELTFANGETRDYGQWVGRGVGQASFAFGPGAFLPSFDGRTITRALFYGEAGTNEANRTKWRANALENSMGASGVARARVVLPERTTPRESLEPLPTCTVELDVQYEDGNPYSEPLRIAWRGEAVGGRAHKGAQTVSSLGGGRYRLRVPAGTIQLNVDESNASGSLPGWSGQVYGYPGRVAAASATLTRGATVCITRPNGWSGDWFLHASWRPTKTSAWRGSWNYSTAEEELVLNAVRAAEWRFQLRQRPSQEPADQTRIARVTQGQMIRVDK